MPIDTLLRELNRRLHALLADPPLTRTRGILSLCLAIPAQTRIPAIDNCSDCLYWSRPSRQHQRVGAGRITLVEAAGAKRFEQLEQALQNGWRMLDPDCTGVTDLVFCGFAFDGDDTHAGASAGLANSLLFIPEVLVDQHAERSRLVVSCRTGNNCDAGALVDNWLYRLRRLLSPADIERPAAREPRRLWPISVPDDRHRWIERVEEALVAIDHGQLRKVVLSRDRRVELPEHFRLRDTLAWLAPRYPDCTLFALRHAGQTLLGVSPENLLTLDRQRLQVDAVGGTAERSADPGRDRQLTAALRHSHKTLREHRLVVEDIVQQLRPYCSGLVYPQQPAILKLPSVQHLHSRISGKARVGTTVLQLATRLHPTAATGGLPRTAALDWLRCHGEQQRGWYTGALGWLNTAGDGELAVILRCAVLGQRQATLYAGAGIVAGSDPQQEFLETEWKLQTMLAALQAGGDSVAQLPAKRHDTRQAP